MAQLCNRKTYHNMALNTIIIMLPQDDNVKAHGNLLLIHATVIKNSANTQDDLTMNYAQDIYKQLFTEFF